MRKSLLTAILLCLGWAVPLARGSGWKPISVHPENPHYFLFRGKPTVLITSAEHYGAIENVEFNYLTYLNTLQAEGMNYTREVNGIICESTNFFSTWRGGDQNPLAPRAGQYLAPWARSSSPGYYFGGNKFDLDKWDESYFRRLKDFVQEAGGRGIVVEINLFYVMYERGDANWGSWNFNPLNARNNVNGDGNISWDRYNTLDDRRVVARQEALLKKTLTELNQYDNVYFEICDEPYWSGASAKETEAWQNRMIEVFATTERFLPNKHLIAVNYANGYAAVEKPNEEVSILNFHYANPPSAVPMNFHLNKPIAFDETAGNGGNLVTERRREAWAFMFSGGAVYNNLDPSFARGDPTGSGKVKQPDGTFDGRELRKHLKILHDFINSFDFIHMKPDPDLARTWPEAGGETYALVQRGKAYAVYLRSGKGEHRNVLVLDLPKGRYFAEWLDTKTGVTEKPRTFDHPGGGLRLDTPAFKDDVALRIRVSRE